jgi:LacI family transcriptional regulator
VKAATIRDVAERADVSVASVSRVLTGAGPVTEATR